MAGRNPKPEGQRKFEKRLAARLTELRKSEFPERDRGVMESRRLFCEKVGIDTGTFQKCESRGVLSSYQLLLICQATGANPFDLLDLTQPIEQISTKSAQIALAANGLSDDDQTHVLEMVRRLPPAAKPGRRKQRQGA